GGTGADGDEGSGGEGGDRDSSSIDASTDAIAPGAYVLWATWASQDGGEVQGSIPLAEGVLYLTYEGQVAGLQTDGGTDDFLPVSTFLSPTVGNAPSGTTMIEVAGSSSTPDSLTFSQPVTNPVVAIYDLGVSFANTASVIVFDAPFTILSSGPNTSGTGYWGNGQLVVAEGGVSGVGGNGVVELEGTFTTIHWTNPADIPFASYTGLTVGVRAAR
ncbi:MAG: hypothetical protein ACRENE_18730, partial [Polyangiaceae bacterium]